MTAHHDPDTVAYFDDHVPHYSTGRLSYPAEVIGREKREGSAIVDIGCGAGNTLAHLRDATGIQDLCGLDVSEKLLERARQEVPGLETHLGSILDRELVDKLGPRFDFAVMSAMLHHLIGRSKRDSHRLACQAVEHAALLLRPGGHVIVVDEAFSPAPMVNAVFWVKKGVTRLTSKRVGLFGYWNNIGPPVVSYYSLRQLEDMSRAGGRAEIVERRVEPERLAAPTRWLLQKSNVTLVARTTASS